MQRTTIWLLFWTALCLAMPASAEGPIRLPSVNAAPAVTLSDPAGDVQRAPAGFAAESTVLQGHLWLSRGPADLGVGFGALTYGLRPKGGPQDVVSYDPYSGFVAAPIMSIGMRYRTSSRSAFYADATGVHGAMVDRGDAVFGKVGFELQSTQSRLNISYGGLGFKLLSDSGMTVRLRRGGLALFMRRSF